MKNTVYRCLFYITISTTIVVIKAGIEYLSDHSLTKTVCANVQSDFQIGSYKTGLIKAKNLLKTRVHRMTLYHKSKLVHDTAEPINQTIKFDCGIVGREDLFFSLFFIHPLTSDIKILPNLLLVISVVVMLMISGNLISHLIQVILNELDSQVNDRILGNKLKKRTHKTNNIVDLILGRALPHLTSLDSMNTYVEILRKKIEEKESSLLKAQEYKVLSDLGKKIAHDIRSPLSLLNIIADRKEPINENEKQMLKQVAQKINSAAENLLTQGKNHEEGIAAISILDILKMCVEEKNLEFKRDQNNPFVVLKTNNSDRSYMVSCEPRQFQSCISNFINNSKEANSEKVEVTFKLENEFIVILISDNGDGISSDVQEKLGKFNITSKPEGNGIGFLNSSLSIQQWGGKLEIFSPNDQHLQRGTSISIRLPLQS